jgi:hypothetical protein
MPNGKPGDHPLTDLFNHGLPVYGEVADELIREIAKLCSNEEFDAWWEKEISRESDSAVILGKAGVQLHSLRQRARERGTETQE